ncbi:MAG: 2-oxo acid dehydrogenase subunit E2 [Treponema sp.]|nr:2-oxo acid dehydrogenase subunit E2 [Treponema sp.]
MSVISSEGTDAEKINSFVTHLPRFCIRFFVWAVKFLDRHNGLPASVIDSLPFFSSVFFTHTGSVGIDAPFHHNFEVGNCGIFCAIGKLRKVNVLNSDGTVERRDKIKMTYTYDDRIADGIYCARTIDTVRTLVESPEKLEIPLELSAEQLCELGLAQKELAPAPVS